MKRGLVKFGVVAALLVSAFGSAGTASAQQVNWDGFYAGVEAGGGRGTSDWNHLGDNGSGPGLPPGDFVADPTPGGPPNQKLSGALGGVHAGFMRQSNGLVLGVEGSWDWSNINGTTTRDSGDVLQNLRVSADWLAMLNGRIGVANGRWLAYASGGLAFANIKAADTGTDPGGSFVVQDNGTVHYGWDAGAGLAYAASESLLIGLEYDHINLGNKDHKITDINGGGDNPFYQIVGVDPTIDIVKARVSFKLGAREPEHTPLK
jgi:outer membrane immunogenic protein